MKVVPPAIIQPIVPTSGDEDVAPTATFSHSQIPNALYTHVFVCDTYQVILDQMSSQVTLPDVTALGITLKSGAKCQWTVYAVSPVPSVDEMAGLDYPKLRELAQKDVVFVSLFGVYFSLAR